MAFIPPICETWEVKRGDILPLGHDQEHSDLLCVESVYISRDEATFTGYCLMHGGNKEITVPVNYRLERWERKEEAI